MLPYEDGRRFLRSCEELHSVSEIPHKLENALWI